MRAGTGTGTGTGTGGVVAMVLLFAAGEARADREHAVVRGTAVVDVERVSSARAATPVRWGAMSATVLPVGSYTLGFSIPAQAGAAGTFAVEIPVCQNRGRLFIDGARSDLTPGAAIVPLDPTRAHRLELEVKVSTYEKRIACGGPPVFGIVGLSRTGLSVIDFESPHGRTGGGSAVVFVPDGHDVKVPGPLLVGVHPWNGGIWTYAAYAELVEAATRHDVVLLMPNGLGNSLYTANPEDEVLRAMGALGAEIALDPARTSIWGASMGGQGATTIGLHRPSRFASITSYFGDARFDTTSYVKSILPTEEAAHQVNPIDVIDNARHVPIWLVHGIDDAVSPVRESDQLKAALDRRAYAVRYDRVPGAGHEAPLVVKFLPEVVKRAAELRAPAFPARVTYRSVRAIDDEAYGVKIVRARAGDAFVDVERRQGGIHVLAAENVARIGLAKGALGATPQDPVVREPGVRVEVGW